MSKYIIGIDPGTKTGLAIWLPEERELSEIRTVTIDVAMDIVKSYINKGEVFVRFEDARLRKWYGHDAGAKRMGAGSVKRDCSIWEDFLKRLGVAYEAVSPMNTMTKMTSDYFKQITGYQKQTSNHARDAALLVFEKSWPHDTMLNYFKKKSK